MHDGFLVLFAVPLKILSRYRDVEVQVSALVLFVNVIIVAEWRLIVKRMESFRILCEETLQYKNMSLYVPYSLTFFVVRVGSRFLTLSVDRSHTFKYEQR